MRRRRRRELSAAAAELAEYAAEAERGDTAAAGRLRAVRSWQNMLRAAGDDPVVGELFVEFARDDRVLRWGAA